jgi:nicotinamidase-related amidase
MKAPMLIRAAESCLVIIDMQERLVPAMQAPARTIRNARILVTAARELGVPVLMTEQYPKGLGRTVPELARAAEAAGARILPKMHFSCMEEAGFAAAFRATGRAQAVLAGMEAHICVVQTAASLMHEGTEVFVVTDATSSRTLESEKACLDRLQALGAGIVTTEMVVFEWLGRAGTPAFKALLPLIK